MIQSITESFSLKKKVCSIYFDIQSAFDRVWHAGLIKKLINIKLPSYLLLWLEAFLKDRRYCVQINETRSNWFFSSCGIPQGAVLSPTLFSLFISDIPQNNDDKNSKFLLFGDDLVYFTIFKEIDVETEYLKRLFDWSIK